MYPGALTLTPTPQPPADIVYDFHAPSDDISPFALKISGGSLWEIDEPNCAPRIQSTGRSPIRFQPCGFYSSLSAVNSPPDSDVALNLQVAAAGYYTPKFTGGGYNDGCIAALYLDGVYLGEYSFFDSAGTSAKEAASLRTLYLDAGRHSLLIRGMREVAANQFWMYPGGLTLQGVHAPPALTQIIATAAESTLQIGETLDVSCQLAFAGGAVIPAAPNLASAASAGIALHYESSAPGIVEVGADNRLTAKAGGEALITVTASIDGVPCGVETSIPLTVLDLDSPLASVSLASSLGTELRGSVTTELSVSGKLENGAAADLTRAEIVYSLVSGDAVALSENRATVIKEGQATVRADVTLDGVTRSDELTLSANPKAVYIFDFKSSDKHPDNTLGRDVRIEEDGWQIDMQNSSPRLAQSNYTRFQPYGLYISITEAGVPRASDCVIDFAIGSDGLYTFNFCGAVDPIGGIAALYIDDIYVGEYSFYNSSYIEQSTYLDMRSLPLTAGVHKLTIRSMRAGVGGKYYNQWPGCLTFTQIDALPIPVEVQAEPDARELSVDGSTVIRASVTMSNRATYPIAANLGGKQDMAMSVAFESLTPDICQVDEQGAVTPLRPGKGVIRVRAQVDGEELETETAVQIFENNLEDVTALFAEEALYVGGSTRLILSGVMTDGTTLSASDFQVAATVDRPEVAKLSQVDGGYVASALSAGSAAFTVTVSYRDFPPRTFQLALTVREDVFAALRFDSPSLYFKPGGSAQQISLTGQKLSGAPVDLAGADIRFESEDSAVAAVDASGLVTPQGEGKTNIRVTVVLDGITVTGSVSVSVSKGKGVRTLYTDKKVAAARENIQAYDWARELRDQAVAEAEPYLDMSVMWNLVATQELPRSWSVGFLDDPKIYHCRYCDTDLRSAYYAYGWLSDPVNDPWKIQCPQCRRKFPSNDFGAFYQLGLDEAGNWSRDRAHAENQKLVDAGQAALSDQYPLSGEGQGSGRHRLGRGRRLRLPHRRYAGKRRRRGPHLHRLLQRLWPVDRRLPPEPGRDLLRPQGVGGRVPIYRRGQVRPGGRGASRPGGGRISGHGHLPLWRGPDPVHAQLRGRRQSGQDPRLHRGIRIHRAGLRQGL